VPLVVVTAVHPRRSRPSTYREKGDQSEREPVRREEESETERREIRE
jgi:hypothetical protein